MIVQIGGHIFQGSDILAGAKEGGAETELFMASEFDASKIGSHTMRLHSAVRLWRRGIGRKRIPADV